MRKSLHMDRSKAILPPTTVAIEQHQVKYEGKLQRQIKKNKAGTIEHHHQQSLPRTEYTEFFLTRNGHDNESPSSIRREQLSVDSVDPSSLDVLKPLSNATSSVTIIWPETSFWKEKIT